MQKNGYINASKYTEHEVFKKKITNYKDKRPQKEKSTYSNYSKRSSK